MPLQITRYSFPLFPLAGLSLLGLIDALVSAQWRHPSSVITLTLLLVLVELFPFRLGKINLAFSYPILYALYLITGAEATLLISVLMLTSINMMRGKAWPKILFNITSRTLALLGTQLIPWLLPMVIGESRDLTYYLIDLFLSSLVYSTISTLLIKWYIFKTVNGRVPEVSFTKIALISVAVATVYDGFMLWLATNPKNTGSGDIGTLFFFLPLVAGSIVVYLFTNLTRANSSLETLFVVSQSINQQNDLPTVLSHVIEEARKLVHGSYGMLYLVEEDGNLKRVVGTSDVSLLKRIPMQVGIIGLVAHFGKPMLIQDIERDARVLQMETLEDTRSLLVVPIHSDSQVVGVISLGKKESYSFREDDLKMMTIFATHAGVAMRNAQYIEEREKRLLLEERNRLAREIHDGLAQDLASAILQVEMLKRIAPGEMVSSLTELQDMVRQTATVVRHSIYSLRPAPYTHVGLIPALRSHLDEVRVNHGIQTHLSSKCNAEHLPSKVSQAVFEICTETVKNAVKHSRATDLWVVLECDSAGLVVKVRDNGVGFHFGQAILQAANRKSFGIENLHSIADSVGGMLDYVTAPGEGTLVTLEISLEEDETDDDSCAVMR
ncbi:GAF domain-containing sensor histidine kinase [Tumebacillus permanentifrigoris]|uniref:histidine kinase n=1 Tax=Tumebacillus permanentifrigoris TaxID=378543 RepID=A0A316DA44_9BACL|nr:GAF domain-containing sensor histidine kinase [Tumebacillus permanentifrigoris]PWK13493.1 histidine kinase/DNA gyrase B/HSP90-like ATPase [Tumebacillus permanentifrigoris]